MLARPNPKRSRKAKSKSTPKPASAPRRAPNRPLAGAEPPDSKKGSAKREAVAARPSKGRKRRKVNHSAPSAAEAQGGGQNSESETNNEDDRKDGEQEDGTSLSQTLPAAQGVNAEGKRKKAHLLKEEEEKARALQAEADQRWEEQVAKEQEELEALQLEKCKTLKSNAEWEAVQAREAKQNKHDVCQAAYGASAELIAKQQESDAMMLHSLAKQRTGAYAQRPGTTALPSGSKTRTLMITDKWLPIIAQRIEDGEKKEDMRHLLIEAKAPSEKTSNVKRAHPVEAQLALPQLPFVAPLSPTCTAVPRERLVLPQLPPTAPSRGLATASSSATEPICGDQQLSLKARTAPPTESPKKDSSAMLVAMMLHARTAKLGKLKPTSPAAEAKSCASNSAGTSF